MSEWKSELARLDIADVAVRLGVQIAPGRRSPRVAVCPFHDDTSPSLHLYQDDDPHYHCFACHAHGDTVELVKQKLGLEFTDALKWLDDSFGLGLARVSRRRAGGPDIRQRALAHLREQQDGSQLGAFAESRGFKRETLTAAGLTTGSLDTFLRSLAGDRAAQEDAVEAGLALAADGDLPTGLRSTSLSPFVRGPSLFIPLNNLRGKLTGVMARPLAGDGPKYRFTAKFRKSEVLFRSDHVRRLIEAGRTAALDGASDRFDLFVVEGVFDALRLESLGFPAVAILGAALSDKQAEQLGELSEFALEKSRVMRLHLFLDSDAAGRRGLADALPRLLRRAAERDFLVDVVAVDPPADAKADPDLLLRSTPPDEARALLRDHLRSSLEVLAAVSLGLSFAETPSALGQLDAAGSIVLQNRLARRFQNLDWPRIWRETEPHKTTLGETSNLEPLTQAYARLADELTGRDAADSARSLPTPFQAGERSAEANLLHALVLARESADTREYPVDVAAWDRIDEGAPAFLPVLEARLQEARGPGRPYLAHYEAKDSGAPRLKCGPCPEDAIQQQYVLAELLRVRPENREVAEQVPAVRYWADQPNLVVTGATRPSKAVSFAYQIDMRALEERPDRSRRRDMFRPFLDCWNSFIRHIGRRIERMQCELIYVARLDIKSFYDNVPRHAVSRVLEGMLPSDETLRTLDIACALGGADGDRRSLLHRWILDHSFGAGGQGYVYVDPATGQATPRVGGGAKGLPQGPVLSSYLANIVLFDLDAALDERVRALDAEATQDDGARTCGGIYARYVDDIVIAARSADDLRSLRGAVEAKLEALGLELNEKSEHLTPMTAEEARNWVVERRGAGFVAYGEIDDQPSPATDLRTGWADIPSLDRRTALSVLHWSALDDPEQTPRERFEELIQKVAEADALRAPDLGHIARRVLLRAALDALEPDGRLPLPDARARYLDHLTNLLKVIRPAPVSGFSRVRSDERPIAEALAASRLYTAVLAGLERLVTSSPEHNPTFSEATRRQIGAAKQALLRWLLDEHLLETLAARLIPEDQQSLVHERLGPQLEIQRASLEERAARALRLQGARPGEQIPARHRSLAPSAPDAPMMRIGWYRTFCPDALEQLPVAASQDLDLVLHLIAAGAQVEGQRLSAPLAVLPLQSFATSIAATAEAQLAALPDMPGTFASRIAGTFLALAGSNGGNAPAFADALPALLAWAAGPGRTDALARRPQLLQRPLPGVTFLPVPPLPNQPGLFGYQAATSRIHALFTLAEADPAEELPRDLVWREAKAVSGLRHFTAELPEHHNLLLDPIRQQRQIDDDLATIADVFEGLVERHGLRAGEKAPLINVFSLVGPTGPRRDSEHGYFALAWSVPRADAERLIFERRGDGLALQRSPHAGAELWRIGQAVSDLFAIPTESEDDEDAVGVDTDRHRLQARLKRTAFGRLRGRWMQDAQVTAALATGTLPHALERILRVLREASGDAEGVGPLALEFLLAGRAMRARIRLGDGVDVAGGWARFLENVGASGLRSGDDDGIFAAPDAFEDLARPARAFARAGSAVQAWSARAPETPCRQALDTIALGLELAGLRSDLRDLALAFLARMSPETLQRLQRVRPDLTAFGSLGPVLLVEPRFGHGQGGGSPTREGEGEPWGYEADWQARELFVTLAEALGARALKGRATLERISTAGWLCILCVMSGSVDYSLETPVGEPEPALRPSFFPLPDPVIAEPLKALATHLLEIPPGRDATDAPLWPWEVTAALAIPEVRTRISTARAALASLRDAAGVVAVVDPEPLRLLVPGEQTAEFFTADGHRYEVPWWRCSFTAASNERIDRAETVAAGDRRFNPCSMLTDGDGVLLVQVVSESLAAISGLALDGEARPGEVPSDLPSPGPEPAPNDAISMTPESPEPQPALADGPGDLIAAEPPPEPEEPTDAHPETAAVSAAQSPPPTGDAAPRPSLSHPVTAPGWREIQERSWRARGQGAGLETSGYGRVGILQYDFHDSYGAEKQLRYFVDGRALDLDLRVDTGIVDYRPSFEEHRRRQVLASVLSCCASLGVEALVLPEYSAHPETVSWIAEHCRERNYSISVWAGTFRQQPGFALGMSDGRYQPLPVASPTAVARPMETHLSVVFRETQSPQPLSFQGAHLTNETPIFHQTLRERVRHRLKKYPSIGMGEEFMPASTPLTPLMEESRSLNRIESFISELVCSELFVFNGPLNWRDFAEHLAACSRRYRLDHDLNHWMEQITADARAAALTFSGAPGHKPRRSLLFVTCATTRDADYHYFAQSAYLASGLVTAFCNGSGPGLTGGSCFVGQGGWETTGVATAVPNPYHGAAPGILSNGEHRGALGRQENALIVADVRPDRTVEDRPRSQARGAPMRLVAHIPILERETSTPLADTWSRSAYRPRRTAWVDPNFAGGRLIQPGKHDELLHEAGSRATIELGDFLDRLSGVVAAASPAAKTLDLDAAQRDQVIAGALSLAALFKDSPGMRQRARSFAEHYATHPERMPCPVLLDWMIVDLGVEAFEAQLRDLQALSEQRQAPTVPLSVLPLGLQKGPWRWCARLEGASD